MSIRLPSAPGLAPLSCSPSPSPGAARAATAAVPRPPAARPARSPPPPPFRRTTPWPRWSRPTSRPTARSSSASDASYAPNEFVDADGTTIIGMDVDLGKAVGQKLGLDVEFQNSAFDGILPGIAAKKYEMGMSSFTDNADREKEVDMVTYFSAGTKMATLKGNPDGLAIDDLCGKTIAAQRGTVQVDDLTARSDTCTEGGQARHHHLPVPGPDRRHAGADRQAGAGDARRLPGRRLRGDPDRWSAGDGRRELRHRAVRHRAAEERRHTTRRPSRARCRR